MSLLLQLLQSVEAVNGHIDRTADDWVSGFHNRRVYLLAFQILAMFLLLADVGNFVLYLYFLQGLQVSAYLKTLMIINIVTCPFSILWAVHVIRSASWHFAAHLRDDE